MKEYQKYLTIINGVVMDCKSTDENGNVTIPEKVGGKPVTAINHWAFFGISGLKNVTIPDSVKTIGDNAFKFCSGLESIVIPDSVTEIGKSAFCECASLSQVALSKSISKINDFTFCGCCNLKSIDIPNSVVSIGESAFRNCNQLKSIDIPNGVVGIGNEAFLWCDNLKKINLPDNVKYIGNGAFAECVNLKAPTANYKAFQITDDGKLKCRDYIFTEGEWSEEVENPELCRRGYHYCRSLYEIFNYGYYGKIDVNFAIYECEVGNSVVESNIEHSTKCVTNKIKPVKRLSRLEIIKILNGEM
ncbi:MAG: leucine-rich repeat domain-containing protein [Acutalibacteraceae bacterium]